MNGRYWVIRDLLEMFNTKIPLRKQNNSSNVTQPLSTNCFAAEVRFMVCMLNIVQATDATSGTASRSP